MKRAKNILRALVLAMSILNDLGQLLNRCTQIHIDRALVDQMMCTPLKKT